MTSVQPLSLVWLVAAPWTAALQASLSITSSWSLLKLMSIVSEALQPSHPLLSPSPPSYNLSPHQGFSQGVSSSHQVAKGLKLQLQHKSFQWIFRTDWFPLGLTGFNSLQSTRVFSNITVQKHQFFGTQLSLWYNSHISHHLQWFWSPRK